MRNGCSVSTHTDDACLGNEIVTLYISPFEKLVTIEKKKKERRSVFGVFWNRSVLPNQYCQGAEKIKVPFTVFPVLSANSFMNKKNWFLLSSLLI